jgi:hypothetical protein
VRTTIRRGRSRSGARRESGRVRVRDLPRGRAAPAAADRGGGGKCRPFAPPEDPTLRMAALEQLRAPGRPFVLHVYASYTGANGWSAAQQVGQEIAQYGDAGFQTELVVCYRPADGGSPADVGGFVEFVREAVRALGPVPGFVSLQVTNEADQGGSPNTSDGYYAGAKDALIDGVIAAKGEIRQDGFGQVKVGFNWACATDGGERGFWRYLGSHARYSFEQRRVRAL